MIHAIVDRRRNIRADFVHVRNKTLDGRNLAALASWYVEHGHQVIVNSRLDIALAAGAMGVHLPQNSLSPSDLRKLTPEGFLIGVSCHSRRALLLAQREGADYAYLSPVNSPISKTDDRPLLGWTGFEEAIAGLAIPVLALGGVAVNDLARSFAAGGAGIAGITLVDFLEAPDTPGVAPPRG